MGRKGEASIKLWEADGERKQRSHMAAFARFVSVKTGEACEDWPSLYRWSCRELGLFWQLLAEFTATLWQQEPSQAFIEPPPGRMLGGQWFPGGKLNYAENLLAGALAASSSQGEPILISLYEGGGRKELSAQELYHAVARCAEGLAGLGVRPGTPVAGVVHNGWEAIVAMLATTALGGVWSSCSPDFGVEGMLARLDQLAPKVLFCSLGYSYNGRYCDCRPSATAVLARLGAQTRGIAIPSPQRPDEELPGWLSFASLGQGAAAGASIAFARLSFDHPLFVMFSSGTTGAPKAIVHGVGGILLQHKKELMCHTDLHPGDRLLFYTTCGWMMWNWMVSALAVGCCVVTYDGSPAYPHTGVLWEMAAQERLTAVGTSPKYLAACESSGLRPSEEFDLSPLRTLLSTGAPLSPAQFSYVYKAIKANLHLASISGGTDIVSCFMLGNPLLPVYAGEIQGPGLGMAISARDEQGQELIEEKGELVCSKPFVAMPLGFLHDEGQKRYRETYFSYYKKGPEVWRHGDYIAITARGGVVVYGRSDATLNPGGVRIGTSEIYRQLEAVAEVDDAVAVGYARGADSEVILFVKMRPEVSLDAALSLKIKHLLRTQLSPRHVPAQIIQVADIPYTRNGKKVELAVTKAIHGQEIDNLAALANPQALEEYRAIKLG